MNDSSTPRLTTGIFYGESNTQEGDTSMSNNELEPCPFCGCKMGILHLNGWQWFGEHGICPLEGNHSAAYGTKEGLIEEWNKRKLQSTVYKTIVNIDEKSLDAIKSIIECLSVDANLSLFTHKKIWELKETLHKEGIL